MKIALLEQATDENEMFNDMEDDNLVHPDKADSTELGEVPQRAEQGSIRQSYINNPYGMGVWYQM